MNIYRTKEKIMYFTLILIVCAVLGYLSHDLTTGIHRGILIGIGFAFIGPIVFKNILKKQS